MKQTGLNRGKRQRIVTALDVGTSKICCLIAKTWSAPDWLEVAGEGMQFEVLGFGHHRAEGLKGGMVTHLDRAEHARQPIRRKCLLSGVLIRGFCECLFG
jgi:cell division protein FtsA